MALGIAVLQGTRSRVFLLNEVPLYPEGPKFECQHMERDLCAHRHEREAPTTTWATSYGPKFNVNRLFAI